MSIVIGDEILKGQVQDVNSYYFAQQLWELGIRVCKVEEVMVYQCNKLCHVVDVYYSRCYKRYC